MLKQLKTLILTISFALQSKLKILLNKIKGTQG